MQKSVKKEENQNNEKIKRKCEGEWKLRIKEEKGDYVKDHLVNMKMKKKK